MRRFVLWALALSVAASASALTPSTSNVFHPEQKPAGHEYQNPPERVHGDTVADPFIIIGSLPFSTTGTTVGFSNDYDYACPYTGSTAPDVVWKYVATRDWGINIDLCPSIYDTKVYVYNSNLAVIACNDDYCAYQSYLHHVPTTTGSTYYIVVDGYGASCGAYYLTVEDWLCSSGYECPPGAMLEGEPECYESYNDTYNGGCNATPFPVFQILEPTGGDILICGTTGVFQCNTLLCRDTDWYQMDITETSNICLSGDSEVPSYFLIIDGRGGCNEPPVVAYGASSPCVPVDMCYMCDPGTWWVWVGPGWDTSYLCGAVYIMTITGYTPDASSVPEEGPDRGTTWGRVKSMFR